MLSGSWAPDDRRSIDFDHLPRVPVEHVIVSDINSTNGVNQHNYLLHHDGRFWVMWSDGPGVEDRVGQVVKYSTSTDGLKWESPQLLTPYQPGCQQPYLDDDEWEVAFGPHEHERPGRSDLKWQALVRDGFHCRGCAVTVTSATSNADHVRPVTLRQPRHGQ